MWKAVWENLSDCEKVSGFEIIWSMLANAHSIFQGVWLPLLWVKCDMEYMGMFCYKHCWTDKQDQGAGEVPERKSHEGINYSDPY